MPVLYQRVLIMTHLMADFRLPARRIASRGPVDRASGATKSGGRKRVTEGRARTPFARRCASCPRNRTSPRHTPDRKASKRGQTSHDEHSLVLTGYRNQTRGSRVDSACARIRLRRDPYPAVSVSSLPAAARASSVMTLPASMRAISSRRWLSSIRLTRVATRSAFIASLAIRK